MEGVSFEAAELAGVWKLGKYDKAYFHDDNPIVSDKYYDQIKQEILYLEKKI